MRRPVIFLTYSSPPDMAYPIKSQNILRFAAVLLICLSSQASAGIQEDFIWAVERGNLSEVSRLLEKGANPDLPNKEGYTPLMIAAQEKNLKMAELLIEVGAKLDLRNRFGETAIMLASYQGFTEMVKLLYIRGAEINHGGWNPLIYAASGGHLDTLRVLLGGGADINSTSDNGSTALMMAVRGNHLKAVSFLLNHGADPRIANEQGDNALSWAEKREHGEIADFLKSYAKSK